MINKKFWLGMLVMALVFGTIGCDNGSNDGSAGSGSSGGTDDITYTVEANGTLAEETTTQLTFTFNKAVSVLKAGDINIFDSTGAARKGILAGGGTSWTLDITVIVPGKVKVKINRTGIEDNEKTVMIHKEGVFPEDEDITYTVTADGTLAKETSTQLTFIFSEEVSDLEAEDIDIIIGIIDGTGAASKGDLTGSGTSWTLEITDIEAGTIDVKIGKKGIESGEKTVMVHKAGVTPADITYTVTADGALAKATTTQLTFTFNVEVSDLQAEDITVANGTGKASKGALTGGGASWKLNITDIEAGTVEVKIDKKGIEDGEKAVIVHKAGDAPVVITYDVTANGAVGTETTTQLTFAFSAAVSGLKAANITVINDTDTESKGALTGSGKTWNLNITVVAAGTVKVKIDKAGIENVEKTVTVHKDSAAGIDSAHATKLTIFQWEEGYLAEQDDVLWYKFEAEEGKDYCVQWRDQTYPVDSENHSAYVLVTAYLSDCETLVSDDFYEADGSYIARPVSELSGTVYLKVELAPAHYYGASPGSFAIRFYDPEFIGPQVTIQIWNAMATIAPSVVLSWSLRSGESEEVSGFKVYRSNTQNGTYTEIGVAPKTSSWMFTYTDRNVRAGRIYWYKVAAYNSKGEGDKSDPKESDEVPNDNATVMEFGTAITGDLKEETQVDWYKFTAEPEKTYTVKWESVAETRNGIWPQDNLYTGRIVVSAFSGSTPIEEFQGKEWGWNYPQTVSGVSGTVYLQVKVFWDVGTYSIIVSEQ